MVRWFEDGVFRFEGDTYDVPNANVNANSRGFYNATVVQHTVNASTSVSVVYRVFVDCKYFLIHYGSVNNYVQYDFNVLCYMYSF